MARKRTKNSLKPIDNHPHDEINAGDCETNNNIEENKSDELFLNDYLMSVENNDILTKITTEVETETHSHEIDELKQKINKLTDENNELRNKLNKISNNTSVDLNQDKYSQLETKNDELILLNSELEYENARLTQTIKMLQEEQDEKLHTFTPNGYTSNQQVKPINNIKRKNNHSYKNALNGYQDWV
jgi:predicted RNase H-like nuclease (RuvC/YqgF family)